MLHDVRFAIRALRQSPTFTATAILTLTFAIAINIGIFATLNAVAFRRLPDRESYYPLLVERVAALPGVSSVSVSRMVTGSPGFKWQVSPMTWEPADGISSTSNAVTPGFFRTLEILLLVSLSACLIPARRAARVDPLVVLRAG